MFGFVFHVNDIQHLTALLRGQLYFFYLFQARDVSRMSLAPFIETQVSIIHLLKTQH